MPTKNSAFKSLRQSKKRHERNKKIKSDITALVRKVRKAASLKDQSKSSEWLKQAVKKIDKASQKGILKKNTAARKKSRLSKLVNSLNKK
jgi:small subunit ribosomal protein S20